MDQAFFDEQTQQSRIKSRIIIGYFIAWSRIIKGKWQGTIGYIDLFSGPGRYEDGTPSVPMLLLEEILKDPSLAKRMRLVFNDSNADNIAKLRENLKSIKGSELVFDRIKFLNKTIDANTWKDIQIDQTVPVFSFIDPFGYKGLTTLLINRLIESNGSDCVFFFNYNRINMALSSNTYFDDHLAMIFGVEGTQALKDKLSRVASDKREEIVVEALVDKLKENKARHVLSYKFYCKEMRRTSHYLIFVTKHDLGCRIMKGIMANQSYKDADGVATFELKDRTNFSSQSEQLNLFDRPLDGLCSELVQKFSGERINIGLLCTSITQDDSNQFVEKNVKDALRRLEEQGVVIVEGRIKTMTSTGVITMPDNAFAIFRERD